LLLDALERDEELAEGALEADVPGCAPREQVAVKALAAVRARDVELVERVGIGRHTSLLTVRACFYAHRVPDDALRRCAAEFLGAFTLTFIGVGAIVTAAGIHDPALIGVALAHGLAIAIMVSALGHISGGHFNPAITLGFLVTRRIEPLLGVAYCAVQFAGAVLAALLVKVLLPRAATDAVNLGVPALGGGVSAGSGLVLEAIFTFLLVFVVFATAVDPRGTFKSIAGLAIGLTITIDILFGGPLTGAAMNPSRAFGPELVGSHWADAWIWYVGPAIGGVVAAVAYELLYLRPVGPQPVGPPETGVIEPRPGDTAAG
jgi:aquaporin TIP